MTITRFVVLADLHAHPWQAFSSGDGITNSRLQRSLAILRASLQRAYDEEIPWLFAGDLVHTAGYALNVVLAGVTETLSAFPEVRKVAIWGNHDARGIGGMITADHTVFSALRRGVPNLFLLGKGVILEHQGITISGEGYQPRLSMLGPPKTTDIGLFHQTVSGTAAPTGLRLEDGIDPEALLHHHRLTIVGHIHHPQEIDSPQGKAILIPGSPEHQTFGDRGEHGWWVVSLPDDPTRDPTAEFIPGGSPEFRTVDRVADIQDDKHFYRVRSLIPGESIPEGSTAIAPSPTTITQRGLLDQAGEVDAVLETWLRTTPPAASLSTDRYLAVGQDLLARQDPIRLRRMIVTLIKITNFGSHADTTLPIRPGIWLVVGQGRDYPSNGAGKSTIFEALYWALFGKNTKGWAADEVIRWGETTCQVTVALQELDSPNQPFLVVTRTRSPDGHHLTVRNSLTEEGAWEAASVTEMTVKLSRYLGLTPEIFQNLGYFSQEKLLLFSSATDGERKAVLADLVGLAAYQQAVTAAGSEIHVLEMRVSTLKATREAHLQHLVREEQVTKEAVDRALEWQAKHKQLLTTRHQELVIHRLADPLPALRHREQALQTKVKAWLAEQLKRAEATEVQEAERRFSVQSEQLTAKIQAISSEQEEYRVMMVGLRGEVECSAEKTRELVQELHERLTQEQEVWEQTSTEISATKREHQLHLHRRQDLTMDLQKAEDSFAQGRCQVCQQTITPEHQTLCLAPLREKVAHATSLVTETEHRLAQLTDQRKAQTKQKEQTNSEYKRWSIQAASHQDLHRFVESLAHLDQQLHVLQDQREQLEDRVQEQAKNLITVNGERYRHHATRRLQIIRNYIRREEEGRNHTQQRLTAEIKQLEQTSNPHTKEVENAKKRVHDITQAIAQGEAEETTLQEEVILHQYWRHAFSREGIQSLLMDEVANRFNQVRGGILPVLTQGIYDVQLSTLSQTRAGELRERTEFLVTEHGQPIPYGALSGGQRRRVDVGIMLTLACTVSEWMGVLGVLGLLILDEVFGFLDESGAEGLVEALKTVTEYIPAVFAVTHDTHLQSLFPETIRIEQDQDGVSHLTDGRSP